LGKSAALAVAADEDAGNDVERPARARQSFTPSGTPASRSIVAPRASAPVHRRFVGVAPARGRGVLDTAGAVASRDALGRAGGGMLSAVGA
jgi:hypothetical protein